MTSAVKTSVETVNTSAIEVAKTVTPEVKDAAVQAILSEGPIEVFKILHDKRGETLALVERLLASAGIEGPFSASKADQPNQVTVELNQRVSPEQVWLGTFKARFDQLSQLHPDVSWEEVEDTLNANPEARNKLRILDEAGFEMTAFGKRDREIIFRTAQTDVTQIVKKYRNIVYDQKAETDSTQPNVNGSAEAIAESLGVGIADPELYRQFKVKTGWMWLKTDADTRKGGIAFAGSPANFYRHRVRDHYNNNSFCPTLIVKQA